MNNSQLARAGLGAALMVALSLAGPPSASAATEPPVGGPSDPAVLTLAEALRLARAHQPSLRQAQAATAVAQAQADQARSALLPQLSATGSYSRATSNFVASPGSLPRNEAGQDPAQLKTYPFWRFGVNASQLIYDFGETTNRWRASKVSAQAQGEAQRTAEAQVFLNVRVAFFSARAAKALVAVAQETLANQEKHLTQIEGYVELGGRPAIDLTQSKADRANAQVQLINAENSYDVARAQLNLAIGVERQVTYELSDEGMDAIEGEDANVDSLLAEAVRGRPELSNLRLALQSQELTVRSTRDQHWPSLSLSSGLTDNGPTLDQLNWNWNGLVALSVPLFQGGLISAQVRQAQAQLVQASAQLDGERQQVRLEVEQARLGVRAAKATIAAAEDALANTRDRYRLAEGRYQAGVGSIIELGDAQVALTAAGAQKVQAEYQLFTARAQLLKALGRL